MPYQTPDPFELAAKRFERTGAATYLNDPVGFATKCLVWPADQQLASYQLEALRDLPLAKRLAIRGPHGLGKTGLKAITVIWFALTREANQIDWKCVTTAGAWRQLEKYLWPEIAKWVKRVDWDLVGGTAWRSGEELLDLSIKLRYGSAFAVASNNHSLIEGAHADEILYIFDESKAIGPKTWEAAEGAFAGQGLALALASSTPGPPSGVFYDIHTHKPGTEDWKTRHVTFEQARAAGRVSLEWALQRAKQWGGCSLRLTDPTHRCAKKCTPNSAAFANRVLGDFHSSDEDSVVPLSWVELAIERWRDWDAAGRPEPPGRQVTGVDVAHGGKAKSVCAVRQGNVVRHIHEYRIADTVKLASIVMSKYLHHLTDLSVVDANGVGAGVADLIRRTPYKNVIAFSAARKSRMRDRSGEFGFVNQRAAMWWRMRQFLDPAFDPTLCLPPEDELIGDLTAPKWWVTPANKIAVESKDDIAKRLGRSTDYGDAACQSLLTEAEFDAVGSDEPAVFQYAEHPNGNGFEYEGSRELDELFAEPAQTFSDR